MRDELIGDLIGELEMCVDVDECLWGLMGVDGVDECLWGLMGVGLVA